MTAFILHINQNFFTLNCRVRKYAFIFLFGFIATFSFSQPIPQQMQTYVEQLHASQQVPVLEIFKDKRNAKEVIESASNYFGDTVSQVRARMYALVGETGSRSQDKTVRSLAVNQLVKATADYSNTDLLLIQLNNFTTSDFSNSAKDSLVSLFRQRPPYLIPPQSHSQRTLSLLNIGYKTINGNIQTSY